MKTTTTEEQKNMNAIDCRPARAQLAVESIRQDALKSGRNRMTIRQIDRVIAATRKARPRKR